jgi:hypothetical protein
MASLFSAKDISDKDAPLRYATGSSSRQRFRSSGSGKAPAIRADGGWPFSAASERE